MRQAAPDAQMIMLDPRRNMASIYKDNQTDSKYFLHTQFHDFNSIDWSELVEPEDTLVFFDDHQNHVRRVAEARKAGFTHLVFDDNYWLKGDTFSLKVTCDLVLNRAIQTKVVYKNHGIQRDIDKDMISTFKDMFKNSIDIYYEFPRMFGSAGSTYDSGMYALDDNKVVEVADHKVDAFLRSNGLTNFPPEEGKRKFTYIAYVRLKRNAM